MSLITREDIGRVAVLTLNRPERLNAMITAMVTELGVHIDAVIADDDIGAMVIAGAGRVFCVGGDIAEMDKVEDPEAFAQSAELLIGVLGRLAASAKPSIAAVHGVALGGGCELVLACDLRIADETARFGLPEVKLGLLPGAAGPARLVRVVPAAIAKQMLLTGDPMPAASALAYGLVNEVVPAGEARAAALALAGRIAGLSSAAVAAAKRVVDEGGELSLAEAIDLERTIVPVLFQGDDRAEGMRAFLEKRPPDFHRSHR
jgi:enoyl-CoA hydratase